MAAWHGCLRALVFAAAAISIPNSAAQATIGEGPQPLVPCLVAGFDLAALAQPHLQFLFVCLSYSSFSLIASAVLYSYGQP
jgi:hypothetical protein